MEIGLMEMPAGADGRCAVGGYQMRDHPPAGRCGNAEISVEKEIPQTIAHNCQVSGFHVGKIIDDRRFKHAEISWLWVRQQKITPAAVAAV